MATPFQEFVEWLTTQDEFSGYTFYVDSYSGNSNQIVLVEIAGVPHPTTPKVNLFMQVHVLNTSIRQAELISWDLYTFLHQHDEIVLPTYRINGIYARATPSTLGKMDMGNNIILYHRIFPIWGNVI